MAKKSKLKRLSERYRYSTILLKELVKTDFKIRYQGSTLGYIWALLRPLFLFIILYFVFVYFLKIGSGIQHWPIALLLGIVIWNFFSEVTNQGLKAIVSNGSMIRKINFPKYVILLSTSVSALINMLINLFVVVIFMLVSKVEFSWSMLLVPLFIAQVYLFALGLAFILSTIYVRYRDINFIWEVVMQGLFYGSAILYPISRIAETHNTLAQILLINPVAQAIQDIRNAAIGPHMQTLATISDGGFVKFIPYIIVSLVLILGALYFRHRSPHFAEEA